MRRTMMKTQQALPMNTAFTAKAGIRYPIMQGGLQAVALPPLAAAVSNAGGLGTINALNFDTPDLFKDGAREMRKLCGKNNFGINLTVLPALNPPNYDLYVQAICEVNKELAGDRPLVVETAGSNLNKIIQKLKEGGLTVVHKSTQVRHALSAHKSGADFVTLDGFECAGHPGEMDIGGLILFAEAAQVLKTQNVPFLCCGGFATGRQVAAALCFGAEGVAMGTRFLAVTEAPIHQGIKDTLVKGTTHDTTHIFRSLHHTGRVYKNKLALEVQALEKKEPGNFKILQPLVSGKRVADGFRTGDPEAGVWSAGPSMGLIKSVETAEALIQQLVAEARAALQVASKL